MTEFNTGVGAGDNGFEAAKKASENAMENFESDPELAIVFTSSKYDYEDVQKGVKEIVGDASIIGSSTAGEFNEEKVGTGQVSVALISSDDMEFFTGFGEGLSEDAEGALEKAAEDLPESIHNYPYTSVINLHDGLAGKGTQVSWNTLEVLGQDFKVAGGSAGDDVALEKTVVFNEDHVSDNAVVLGVIASEKPVAMAVDHGHEPISPPLEITKSEGSTVHEINNKPAFEVWKEQVRYDAEEELCIDVDQIEGGDEELGILLKRYGFGIQSAKGYKVRWPGLTSDVDGPLEFACDMPENTVVRIMASPKDKQIEASRKAAKKASEKMEGDIAGGLIFECIVRANILQERFPEAVEEISDEIGAPLAGFETYGEICIERGEMSGFHNTTTVVMLLPK